jgi:hypothetical protein
VCVCVCKKKHPRQQQTTEFLSHSWQTEQITSVKAERRAPVHHEYRMLLEKDSGERTGAWSMPWLGTLLHFGCSRSAEHFLGIASLRQSFSS